MIEVPLSVVKDQLSKYIKLASEEKVVITRHGKAVGVLAGFATEDDWIEYRLENDPRFLSRIAEARASFQEARATPIEDVD
jgi:hypothetical protein